MEQLFPNYKSYTDVYDKLGLLTNKVIWRIKCLPTGMIQNYRNYVCVSCHSKSNVSDMTHFFKHGGSHRVILPGFQNN